MIFIICHTQKARIESADDVGAHSIRDSSFISQESDIILFIWCNIKEDGAILKSSQFLKVCKSRRTGLMFKTILVTKVGNYLAEQEPYL